MFAEKKKEKKERGVVPPPPSPPPSLSILLPSPVHPTPLAAGRTAEGQSEKRRGERSKDTERGRGRDRGGVLGCKRTCREESVWTSDDSHAEPKDQTDQER